MKPESWLETLNCAVEGVVHAVKTQRHMRWHALACVLILVVAPRLAVTASEFALLCLAAGLVLVAELGNTAIEAVVDLSTDEYHPLARAAKDVAAGAVLVAAFAAATVGWVVLSPKVGMVTTEALDRLDSQQPVAAAAIILVILVLVILLKAKGGRGRPLQGGLPSGHAAVSFGIATFLILLTREFLVGILAVILAGMVSHSRLLLRIHTHLEVALGAALGVVVSALLYWFFS